MQLGPMATSGGIDRRLSSRFANFCNGDRGANLGF
jgi:hypothetical protein